MIWWVVFLFFAGAFLVFAEFIVPGGICGTAGALMLVASACMGVYYYPDYAFGIVIAEGIGVIVCILLGLYAFPRSPFGKVVILNSRQDASEGWVSDPTEQALVGATGQVVTALRPVGTIVVNDRKLQAVSEGVFIEEGESVKVIEVHGNRIVVERDNAGES